VLYAKEKKITTTENQVNQKTKHKTSGIKEQEKREKKQIRKKNH